VTTHARCTILRDLLIKMEVKLRVEFGVSGLRPKAFVLGSALMGAPRISRFSLDFDLHGCRRSGSFHLASLGPYCAVRLESNPSLRDGSLCSHTQSSSLRTDSVEYTDISSERNTLTFLSGANKLCKRKAEMSDLRKVEMSPFTLLTKTWEGCFGVVDSERARFAADRGPD
jgi:hypothetical protein